MPVISTSVGRHCATDGSSRAMTPSTRAGPDTASRRSRRASANNRQRLAPARRDPTKHRFRPVPASQPRADGPQQGARGGAPDPGDGRPSRGRGPKRAGAGRARCPATSPPRWRQSTRRGKRVAKPLPAKLFAPTWLTPPFGSAASRRPVFRSAEFRGLLPTSGTWRRPRRDIDQRDTKANGARAPMPRRTLVAVSHDLFAERSARRIR